MTGTRGETTALVVLVVLGIALVVALVVTTPWSPLASVGDGDQRDDLLVQPDPARDFTAEQISRGDAFHAALRPATIGGLLASVVVLLVLALTPLGARLVERVWPGAGGAGVEGALAWPWALILGTIAVTAVVRLATLPFAAWAREVRLRHGLSTQSWAGWAVDLGKGWVLTTTVTVLALLVLVALARRLPTTWWAPAAVLAAVGVVVASFAYPLVVEPLFNRFTSMPDSPLRTELVELAERDGQPVSDVLVADASRRTTALNAYVSGFGSTRRIVVYDTLLDGATPAEVRTVVAHELGHTARDDVLRGTLLGALGAAAGVIVLFLVTTSPWFLRRADVDGAGDVGVVALVLATVTVLMLLTAPLQALVSRRVEARADVHALELTRDVDTFVAQQRRLAVANRSDLDPPAVVYGLFATHPTAPERIALARTWERLTD